MALDKIADRIVETDVLVIGGGIAGCPAAAKAAEHGLKVTLVEKSKLDRSGSAAQGIDHYAGAFPRGMTPLEYEEMCEKLGKDYVFYGAVPYVDPTLMYRLTANGMWAIEELEKLGVTMRWGDGELRPIRSVRKVPFLRVHWQNVKPEMAAGVRKRGVNVLDRTMILDLLKNKGAVVGATAINTRTGEFTVIMAKATIIATAACSRIYDPETPVPWKYKFRYHWCPASVSGDGWAMAYRAGAELANMEQGGRGYRPRDDSTFSVGNQNNEGVRAKYFTWDGEELATPKPSKLAELEKQGRDPFYTSIENLSDDFHKRVEVAFVDERMISFKIAEDRGFNPRTHWFERMDNRPNQLHVPPGIVVGDDFKTSLEGLYAIGDCVAGCHDVANAATAGFLVGDTIHTLIGESEKPVVDEAQVESQKEEAFAPMAVKDGTEPMELECAIRYICTRYIGVSKSEGKLREGIRRLGSLRKVFLPKLMAENPHFLMRSLEVRNLLDVSEAHIQASLERNETRGHHVRLDYPDSNPELDGMIMHQRMEDKKTVIKMKKLEPIKFSDNHKEER
jgi:succinate dehydrogenase/fumarate reductase flavoprotein subunit